MNATLDKRKINLVQTVLALDNKETISKVENLLNEERIRIYEESISKKLTHEELNAMLEQADRDFENGDFHTSEELKTMMKSW